MAFCTVRGKEFSPNDFQSRDFSFFRIPWLKLQISPTVYQSQAPITSNIDVLKHLKTNYSKKIWHVYDSNLYEDETLPATLLTNPLSRVNTDGESPWGAWSFKNPKLAAILWPIVQDMARENLYLEIPPVMRFAEGYQGDPSRFESELIRQLHTSLQARKSRYDQLPNDWSKVRMVESDAIPDWDTIKAWLQKYPLPKDDDSQSAKQQPEAKKNP